MHDLFSGSGCPPAASGRRGVGARGEGEGEGEKEEEGGGEGRAGTRRMLLEFRDGRSIQLSMRVLAGSAAFGIGRNSSADEDYLQVTSLAAVKYVSGYHCNLRVGPGLGFWGLKSV